MEVALRYDVPLKSPFLRGGDGIIQRLLFGGKVTKTVRSIMSSSKPPTRLA